MTPDSGQAPGGGRLSGRGRTRIRLATKTGLAFCGLTLLCVGVTATVLVGAGRSSLEEAIVEKQVLLTRNRAIALRDNLELAMRELVQVADGSHIDLTDDDLEPERDLLRHAWRQSPFFNVTVQLIDVDGRCRWAEPDPERCTDRNLATEGWMDRAMAADAPMFMYTSEPDGTGIANLVVPIRRSGKTAGLIRGIVDLRDDRMLGPALHDELPDDTRVMLVSNTGATVFLSEPSLDTTPFQSALDEVRTGRAGSMIEVTDRGRELIAWSPVDYAGLGLVFAWPWDSLDDSLEQQLRSVVLLIALITLAALGLGYIAAGVVTRPIVRLASVVRSAPTKPLRLPEPTARTDELGELQRAFRQLLETIDERDEQIHADMQQIAELASSLERRVEERTAELKEAQAALIATERLAVIGKAGAALSHELRNSLNSISIGIDVLSRHSSSDPSVHAVREQVRGEVARLRTLADDLLSFAREPTLELRGCDLRTLATTAASLVHEHGNSSAVTIDVELPEHPCSACLDANKIQSVMVNLLRNAIEAASGSDDARVRLNLWCTETEAVIRVEDSGPGVDPEVHPKLFEPFVTTKRTGVGLGLATANRFARAHGGWIEIGKGPLGGACFDMHLPTRAPETATP